MATIQETIRPWPPSPGGSGGVIGPMDRQSFDPATSRIEEVETKGELIWITVQKPDKGFVKIAVNLKQIVPPEKAVLEKVVKALESAIGKTLNAAGEIII